MFHPVQLVVQVDGKDYKTFTIGVGNRNGRGFDARLHLPEGEHIRQRQDDPAALRRTGAGSLRQSSRKRLRSS